MCPRACESYMLLIPEFNLVAESKTRLSRRNKDEKMTEVYQASGNRHCPSPALTGWANFFSRLRRWNANLCGVSGSRNHSRRDESRPNIFLLVLIRPCLA